GRAFENAQQHEQGGDTQRRINQIASGVPPKFAALLLIQLLGDGGGKFVVERKLLQSDVVAARVVRASLDANGADDNLLELIQFLRRAIDDFAVRAFALEMRRNGDGGGKTLD